MGEGGKTSGGDTCRSGGEGRRRREGRRREGRKWEGRRRGGKEVRKVGPEEGRRRMSGKKRMWYKQFKSQLHEL